VAGPVLPLIDAAAATIGARDGRLVVAVDGRSASGKSLVAEHLSRRLPSSAVVHTDDLAWHESFFGWDDAARRDILVPYLQGQDVDHRPPAWEERGRPGSIAVPIGTRILILEGVGSSRRSLSDLIDFALWLECSPEVAFNRYLTREGDTAEAREFWDQWDAEEVNFLAHDEPWTRANFLLRTDPDGAG
jgi:hypothetical protein